MGDSGDIGCADGEVGTTGGRGRRETAGIVGAGIAAGTLGRTDFKLAALAKRLPAAMMGVGILAGKSALGDLAAAAASAFLFR